jgi:hypothetical protein
MVQLLSEFFFCFRETDSCWKDFDINAEKLIPALLMEVNLK